MRKPMGFCVLLSASSKEPIIRRSTSRMHITSSCMVRSVCKDDDWLVIPAYCKQQRVLR